MESHDVLEVSVLVHADVEKSFYAFAQQMTSWWPRQYTWSGDDLGHIVLDPEKDGVWYETNSSGDRQPDWGAVLEWQPPSLLRLSWAVSGDRQPETDPENRSEVTVRFTAQSDETTLVDLQHSGFSRHGSAGQSYRDAMAGTDGWPTVLESFAAFASRSIGDELLGRAS